MRIPLFLMLTLLAGSATAVDTIENPLIVSPTVTLSGALGPGADAALTARGIQTIIDLRTPEEGIDADRIRFEAAGLRYINFPTTAVAPDAERLAEFVALLNVETRAPMLMHCVSGNRAGMMWGLYALKQGTPLPAVLETVAPLVTKAPLREEIERHAAAVTVPQVQAAL